MNSLRKNAASKTRPLVAVACRPENLDEVRKLVEEAGVDLQIVTDPEAPGLLRHLDQRALEEDYPEEVRERAESPDEPTGVAEREGGPLRLIIHRPERPQTIRIETGPEGTAIHLDRYPLASSQSSPPGLLFCPNNGSPLPMVRYERGRSTERADTMVPHP